VCGVVDKGRNVGFVSVKYLLQRCFNASTAILLVAGDGDARTGRLGRVAFSEKEGAAFVRFATVTRLASMLPSAMGKLD